MSVFFVRVWVDGDNIVAVSTGEGQITDTGDYGSATYIDAVAEGAIVDAGTLRPTLSYANNQLSSSLVTIYPAKDVNALLAQEGYTGQAVYNWGDGNFYQWNGAPWAATPITQASVTAIAIGAAADLGDGVVSYDNFASDVTSILDAKVNSADFNITVEYQQQLEDATTQLATDALTLALNASALESRINDAGITVDPDTGSVTIQGLSAIEGRVNTVEVDLDAVEGELSLKASTTYVDNAIAAATLPEATLAELEDTIARVDTAEININSLTNTLTLSSTSSLYDVNDGTLGVEALESRISLAEGNITLKAAQTELDAVDTRLETAEITLSTLDVPTLTFTVQEVQGISDQIDNQSEQTLAQILQAYNDRKYIREDVALARISLTADVDDQRVALAGVRTELLSSIDANAAAIVSEQSTRADADSALSQQITSLSATVGTNTAAITSEQTARANADGALAQDIFDLRTEVDDTYARITRVATIEQDVTDIEAKYGVNIDVNGIVTGYQLIAGTGTPSAFNVRSDQFNVYTPAGTTVDGGAVFTVLTSPAVVDGVSRPAGVYANGSIAAESISVGTPGEQGLFVNVGGAPQAVYVYQDVTSTYALYAQSLNTGGGAIQVVSPGGFSGQFLNTTNGTGAFGSYCAIDAQTTAASGGKVRLGVSGTNGGWAVEAYAGGIYGAVTAPFTGAHEGMLSKSVAYEIGDILIDGDFIVTKIDDAFGEVHLSSAANQKGAVGVLSKVQDSWYTPISFIDQEATNRAAEGFTPTKMEPAPPRVTTHNVSDYEDDYYLVAINALGEGGINVTGEGGDISKGDVIVTSSTPGKGMRGADDTPLPFIVAKARKNVTFNDPTEVKMIPCIYMCG